MKKILGLIYLSLISFTALAKQDAVVLDFSKNSIPTHRISPNLIGFNIIYSHYGDDLWTNTPLISSLKQMKTSFLRWPGGAPTNRYHWNDLNGHGWKDSWDPKYDAASDLPDSLFTDLDEYMEIVRETGAIPLVGINQGSGLKYNRVKDGIEEAKALVQYCEDKGYNVDYYFLDNEPYHKGANYRMTWEEYAEQIKLYAPEIKKINPDAKIVINWSKIRSGHFWNILKEAGDYIDMVEIHWYWWHGKATFDTWVSQIPMSSASTNSKEGAIKTRSYKEDIKYFYKQCEKLGLDHIKLGSFEWNVGPSATPAEFPTKYENTIMQAEMLMQFMDGGLEIATLWPIYWPKLAKDKNYNPNRYIMDPTKDYTLSPSVTMHTMLSKALGKNKHNITSSDSTIYSLAAESQDEKEMIIYSLSKSDKGRWINLNIPKYSKVSYEILKPSNPKRGWGKKEIQPAEKITYNEKKGCYGYYLPAYSLGQITLTN